MPEGRTIEHALEIEEQGEGQKLHEIYRPRTPEESSLHLSTKRHGEKESEGEDPKLTEKGRHQASEAGKRLKVNLGVAVGHGSPRHRTEETIQRIIGASRPDVIRDDMTAEEVEAAIAEEMKKHKMLGRKTIIDSRLNFLMEGEYKDSAMRALKEKRYLRFLVDDSDQVVIATGDRTSTSLVRQAGNIAEKIKSYGVGAAKGWRKAVVGNETERAKLQQKIAEAEAAGLPIPEKVKEKLEKLPNYKQYNYALERYLGTHGGVAESFVVKLLHQKQGADVMHEFINAYPNGFSELDGVDIDVELVNDEPRFTLTYELPAKEEGGEAEKHTVQFEMSDLDSIIKQREALERMVERAAA